MDESELTWSKYRIPCIIVLQMTEGGVLKIIKMGRSFL